MIEAASVKAMRRLMINDEHLRVNINKHRAFNQVRLRRLMINDKHLSLSCRMSMGTVVVYLYHPRCGI